ncbi:riboflavin kinase [Bacillus gobiensis]|uniref:riboflavin kinase n=1 Tax=Bacillus gobiensis TaxID=1441095 RepID=UPI003D1C567E
MALTALSSNLNEGRLISGRVITGRKLGRQLGFPTANIDANVNGLVNGVYGVVAELRETKYLGVMNIGVKPTVDSNLQKTTEIFLLDFNDNIYGEYLVCELLFKIREERKFASLELLKQQIKEDILYAKERFKLTGITTKSEQNYFTEKRVFKSS